MHCDTSASWPTAAAQALSRAFPEIVTEVNKNNQTAQQTFEGGVDAEEPAVSTPDERPAASSKPAKGKRLNKAEAAQEFQEKAAAARNGKCCTLVLKQAGCSCCGVHHAAAIAATKKKASKHLEGANGAPGPLVWLAIVLAVLAALYAVFAPGSEAP